MLSLFQRAKERHHAYGDGGVAITGGFARFPLRIASAAAGGPRVNCDPPEFTLGQPGGLSLKDQ